MTKTFRASIRLGLALLLALSPTVQLHGAAERAPWCTPGGCAPPGADRLVLSDAAAAVAAAITRSATEVASSTHRTDERAGVDVLFRARTDLLLARAQVSLEEYRSTVLSLRPARLGRSATASRAPPFLI